MVNYDEISFKAPIFIIRLKLKEIKIERRRRRRRRNIRRNSYPKILSCKFMLSFPPCLLLLHILYKTHSNLKHLSNPNQNENITHWKAIKQSNFKHINREKRQTLHTHTHIHGERQRPRKQCRYQWLELKIERGCTKV